MELERTMQQWSWGGPRFRWGAIFAGLAVGIAVQMMLTLLGLAIGAWAIDVREANAGSGVPLGTGIWTAISMLIAAFAGGYVAARMGGAIERTDGVYYGIVVWAVTWLTFAWLTTTVLSFMIGGLFNAFGSAVQGIGGAVSRMTGNSAINLSVDDVQHQIESVLQATGKKELQPGEIKRDTDRLTEQAQTGQSIAKLHESGMQEVRDKLGALDREAAINVMVNKLGMTRPQAEQVANSTIGLLGSAQQTGQNLKQQSLETVNTAVNQIASAAWWMFLLALVTLGVSSAGGATGAYEQPMVQVQGESMRDVRRTG